jgi:hypothetical protein
MPEPELNLPVYVTEPTKPTTPPAQTLAQAINKHRTRRMKQVRTRARNRRHKRPQTKFY